MEKFASVLIILLTTGIAIGFYYGIYRLIKHFIRYRVDYENQTRAAQEEYYQAMQELDEIERELKERAEAEAKRESGDEG